MAESVYKLFMGRKLEAWYQLSEEQQKSIEAKLIEALEKVGAKRLIVCDSSWPRINGLLLESRSSRTWRQSRNTWRRLTN